MRMFILLQLLFACSMSVVHAADKEKQIDPAKFIEGLVNRNPAPKFQKIGTSGSLEPVFEETYDWKEKSRVFQEVRGLTDHTEVLWPELVKHLEDDRYCIDLAGDGGFHTYTVGEVCRKIVIDALGQSYQQFVPRRTKTAVGRYSRPMGLVEAKEIKKWCDDRKDKKLYELQIESARWAIDELKKAPADQWVTVQERDDWIAKIEISVQELQKTKKAYSVHSFRGDYWSTYKAERAAETRARLGRTE